MPENPLFRRLQPPPYAYKPTWYFFYGTLTSPAILRGVLGLESEPVLRSAKTYGYELANWGQYKTLIDSEPGTEVTGRAYMVQSAEQERKLAYYETNAYRLAPCAIYFSDSPDGKADEAPTIGKTFRYAGDAQALKQGRFD
ncbi:dcef45f7-a37a-4e8a-9462-e1f16ed37e11 [Thermothielavioides terrestris]|uniref:Putative gamma-glutamylcyclotransferase n=1 Tax=Thermothielavioides terrestris TaxID=2587410 RepID=A0A3S4C302_9PEZI|nr:dcef45f7-a37a-4e8a-9462-e1f16ed37e11 [Thermothielavioides terrestris]